MAYPYDGMFYPTLPEDTQDFGQVLAGVGRNLRDFGRGVSYLPMDLTGMAADIGNYPLQGIDYLVNQIRGTDQNYLSTDRPFGGSAQLIDVATKLGLSQQPTGSAPETIGRVMAGLINPMAGARAVGRVGEITTEQANRAADALVRQITGNPTATAPQVLQETSMPFMQAVAPKAPSLLEAPVKSDLGFYSALEQATIPLQNKGTGSQFLAQIEKTAGVKPDEIKWTGLDEFLKSKPNVTKAEVQDYLVANRVNLQEVQLGGPEAFDANRLSQLEDEFAMLKQHPIDDPNFGEAKYDEMIRLMNIRDQSTTSDLYRQADNAMMYAQRAQARGAQRAAENLFRQYELLNTRAEKLDLQDMGIANPTKFSQYTLPGGQNYREILLTLPEKLRTKSFAEVNEGRAVRGAAPLTQERYDELAARGGFQDYAEGTFRASHFDESNILAHMRVNDRVVDGKKTLFIEEIQSDWHQAGRKKGYQQQTRPVSEIQKELDFLVTELRSKPGVSYAPSEEDWARYPEITSKYDALQSEWKEASKQKTRDAVPDAPFKTTWHELSLKRAIQEASEKGYDQIAFTTGKTQAERYDLSKRIGKISYQPETQQLYVYAKEESIFAPILSKIVSKDQLSDYIGKEAAERLLNSRIKNIPTEKGMQPFHQIKAKDLEIGGEGMKGFYDQILPKTLEKMGKKFDAKVGKADMDGVEVWKMDITPKMRESVLTKGQPLFAATPALPALGLLGGEEE